MSKKLFEIVSLLIMGSMVLSACGPKVQEGTVATGDVVTMYGYSTTDIPTLDPQKGEDTVSIVYIENLFVHLTNYDAVTADIVPEAATSWDISDDGLTYTFTVRTDIPWVNLNPETGEVKQKLELLSGFTGVPVAVGDHLYLFDHLGYLYSYRMG